jgi:hypothetical protein
MAVKKTSRPKPMSEREKFIQTTKPAPRKLVKKLPKPPVSLAGKPTAKKKPMPGKLTGADALKAYQNEISPKGMAKTKAKQTAALDKLMEKRYGKKK